MQALENKNFIFFFVAQRIIDGNFHSTNPQGTMLYFLFFFFLQFNGVCCHSKLLANQTTGSQSTTGGNRTQLGNNADGSRIVSGENSYLGEFPFMVGKMQSSRYQEHY